MGRTGATVESVVEIATLPRLKLGILPVLLIATLAACGAPRQTAIDPAANQNSAPTQTDEKPQIALPAPTVQPRPDSKRMMGLNRNDLASLLGSPTLRRTDPPAEVWQYRDNSCVLHVFLYQDPISGGYAVTYVDTVQRGSGLLSNDDCFGAILYSDGHARDS